MSFKMTSEIKLKIKKKVKKYAGILTLAAVLGGGIYQYVTISRASAQTDLAAEQGASGEQKNPGTGDTGDQDSGYGREGNTGSGSTEPGNVGDGSVGPGNEGNESIGPENAGNGSTEQGNEGSGSTGPGNEGNGSTGPGNTEDDSAGPGNEPGTGDLSGDEPVVEDPKDAVPGTENPVAAGAISLDGVLGNALARAAQIGIVVTNGGTLYVRKGPGTDHDIITYIYQGTTVTILGEENGWYKVNYGGGEGYVSKDYIKLQDSNGVVTDPDADPQYIQQLINAGFPQSYAVPLAGLHAKHPSWIFEPVKTNLDWNKVITEESVLGVNMVPISANDSWKSTAAGAYNWANNKWTVLDGSSWVGASPAVISYYMDPRNFLNDTYIFQFETLQLASYQNEADVQKVLAGTFMSGALRDDGSRTYASTFMEAGQSAKVNPTHLAARCKQEQGKGTSPLISGTYPGFAGYYNYFNIGAYGTPTSVLYQRGLTTAKNNGWNSVRASIVGGASEVAKKYVNLGQDTLYFQKFNVTNSYSGLFRHQYMANVQAAESEGRTMGNAYSNKEQAYVFRIPVYTNMPENACALPNNGNPNNWLKSLTVNGYNLTPAFNGGKNEYSLIVGKEVSAVTLSASTVASTSSISGTGTVNLKHGSNPVKVTCTAQNGAVREYVVNIVRQGNAQVIKGDANGDGSISLLDVLVVKRHILGIETLTGEKFQAADINGDGKVDLLDCLKIKRHILGYEIIQ